jgi:hypothetical protein
MKCKDSDKFDERGIDVSGVHRTNHQEYIKL